MVTVRTMFPNPKSVLLPGMFVRARIEEGVNENAILVPQAGVTHNPQGQATALVAGPDNKVQLRTLQLGATHGDQWVVETGLNEGDRVIVAGLQRAQPGATVVATEAPSAQQSAPTPADASAASPQNTPAPRVVADAKPTQQRAASTQTK
jgi:membrane fusion protein (multidrug efflux system)